MDGYDLAWAKRSQQKVDDDHTKSLDWACSTHPATNLYSPSTPPIVLGPATDMADLIADFDRTSTYQTHVVDTPFVDLIFHLVH